MDHHHVLTSHLQQSTDNKLSFSEGSNLDMEESMMSTSLISVQWYDENAFVTMCTNSSINV